MRSSQKDTNKNNSDTDIFTLTALPGMKLGIHVEQNGIVTKVNPNSIFKNYLSNIPQSKYQIIKINDIFLHNKTTKEIRSIISSLPTTSSMEPRKFTVRCIHNDDEEKIEPSNNNNTAKKEEPPQTFLAKAFNVVVPSSHMQATTATTTGYVNGDEGNSSDLDSDVVSNIENDDNNSKVLQTESTSSEKSVITSKETNIFIQNQCNSIPTKTTKQYDIDKNEEKSQDHRGNFTSGRNSTSQKRRPSRMMMMTMSDDDPNFVIRKNLRSFSSHAADVESEENDDDDKQQSGVIQEYKSSLVARSKPPREESLTKRLSSCTDTGTEYVGSTCRRSSHEMNQFGNETKQAMKQTIGSIRMSTGNGVQYLQTTYNNASQRAMDGVDTLVGDQPEGQLLLCEDGLQYVAVGANKCEDGLVYLQSNNCRDQSQQQQDLKEDFDDDDFEYLTNPCNSMRCGGDEEEFIIEGSTNTAKSSLAAAAMNVHYGEDDSTDEGERLSTKCVTTHNSSNDVNNSDIESGMMKPLSIMESIKCLSACNATTTSNAIDRTIKDNEEYQDQSNNKIGIWPIIRQNKRKGPPTVVRLNMAGEFDCDDNEIRQVAGYGAEDDDGNNDDSFSKDTAETNHDSSNVSSRSSNNEGRIVAALADLDSATGVSRTLCCARRPAIVMTNIFIILAVIGSVVIFFTVGIRQTIET